MHSYNGFTASQREAGDKLIKQAIAEGILPPIKDCKCVVCGQGRGIKHYHCEDYSPDKILEDAQCYCWRCHMIWHRRYKHPEKAQKYFDEVKAGKMWPPVYRHDFTILLLDHGID